MNYLSDPRLFNELSAPRTLAAEEQRNLATVDLLVELFNKGDIENFVRRTYHPDYRMQVLDGLAWSGRRPDGQNVFEGYDGFIAFEAYIYRICPGRRFHLNRAIAAGNVVTVQMSLIDVDHPDWELPWCSVYTFKDGLIIADSAYLNHTDWPGVADVLANGLEAG
jgi:predicted SnoaL-like aldol condensation-catalyzing enzyme